MKQHGLRIFRKRLERVFAPLLAPPRPPPYLAEAKIFSHNVA